jgi:sigma-B regulation protein RsbU (phosphoserine phosphatase)
VKNTAGSPKRKEEEKRARIVLVDDDDLVLSSLRTLFEISVGYEVLAFGDPLQAVEAVARTPVDLVISDYLMPKLNGIDLLKQVQRLQPEAARILLTGFADKQNAIKAINEAGLYQYLEKPWDNDQLLLSARRALQEKSLRRQLAEKVTALDQLLTEFNELAERQRRLEQELEMAARVQQSLLPSRFPAIHGFQVNSLYRPCHAIGGDYYDFVRRDGRTVILVSDVTGHGIQAALISMLIKATFHDTGMSARGPDEVFAEMNTRLRRFLPEGFYAAAALLWLDEDSSAVRLANAGLPYPFVLRPSQQRLDEIPLAGFPLGMFDRCGPDSYEVRPIEMTRGDVLLISSDGLGEISGEQDEFFRDQRLRQTLGGLNGQTGAELIRHLMEEAGQFSNNRQLPDDVTMVAITRT